MRQLSVFGKMLLVDPITPKKDFDTFYPERNILVEFRSIPFVTSFGIKSFIMFLSFFCYSPFLLDGGRVKGAKKSLRGGHRNVYKGKVMRF